MSAFAASDVEYEGFLVKQSSSRKEWKLRFFALMNTSGELEYYEKPEHRGTKAARGAIQVHGSRVSSYDEARTSGEGAPGYPFEILSRKQRYVLSAESVSERENWLDALRRGGAVLSVYRKVVLHSDEDTASRPSVASSRSSLSSHGATDGHDQSSARQEKRSSKTAEDQTFGVDALRLSSDDAGAGANDQTSVFSVEQEQDESSSVVTSSSRGSRRPKSKRRGKKEKKSEKRELTEEQRARRRERREARQRALDDAGAAQPFPPASIADPKATERLFDTEDADVPSMDQWQRGDGERDTATGGIESRGGEAVSPRNAPLFGETRDPASSTSTNEPLSTLYGNVRGSSYESEAFLGGKVREDGNLPSAMHAVPSDAGVPGLPPRRLGAGENFASSASGPAHGGDDADRGMYRPSDTFSDGDTLSPSRNTWAADLYARGSPAESSGGEDSDAEVGSRNGSGASGSAALPRPSRHSPTLPPTPNSVPSTGIVMQGTLQKRGHQRKNWSERFFVLDRRAGRSILSYFKSQNEGARGQAKGRITIDGAVVLPYSRKPFAFEIKCGATGDLYPLAAHDSGTAHRWLEALRAAGASIDGVEACATPLQDSRRDSMASTGTAESGGLPASGVPARVGETVRSGFLLKLGAKVKNWKSRYFLLTGSSGTGAGVLYYYANEKKTAPGNLLGAIKLQGAAIKNAGKKYPKPYGIEIATLEVDANGGHGQGRTYVLSAPSSSEQQGWIDDLLAASVPISSQAPPKPEAPAPLHSHLLANASLSPEQDDTPNVQRGALWHGSLVKLGGKVKTWKQRWFTLDSDFLRYYRSPGDSEVQGEIPIRGAHLRAAERPTRQFCVVLQAPLVSRDFFFCADSRASLKDFGDAMYRAGVVVESLEPRESVAGFSGLSREKYFSGL